MKKLVIVIPALNEEATIASVVREIPRTVEGIDAVEVVILDDGSTDRTGLVARDAGADMVVRHSVNKGLAAAFFDAVETALMRGADIIVCTDADNHYNQSRIPELVRPLIAGEADIVIGGRAVETLTHMPRANRIGNRIGSTVVSRLAQFPRTYDVSSGFRAYSRDAATRINVFSRHTYTHETLIQAAQQGLVVVEVVIPARPVARRSRLIASVPRHVMKSLTTIMRILVFYRPLRFFSYIGAMLFGIGLAFDAFVGVHFLRTGSFTPFKSVAFIGGSLNLLGILTMFVGLIADMLTRLRITQERALYYSKKIYYDRFRP